MREDLRRRPLRRYPVSADSAVSGGARDWQSYGGARPSWIKFSAEVLYRWPFLREQESAITTTTTTIISTAHALPSSFSSANPFPSSPSSFSAHALALARIFFALSRWIDYIGLDENSGRDGLGLGRALTAFDFRCGRCPDGSWYRSAIKTHISLSLVPPAPCKCIGLGAPEPGRREEWSKWINREVIHKYERYGCGKTTCKLALMISLDSSLSLYTEPIWLTTNCVHGSIIFAGTLGLKYLNAAALQRNSGTLWLATRMIYWNRKDYLENHVAVGRATKQASSSKWNTICIDFNTPKWTNSPCIEKESSVEFYYDSPNAPDIHVLNSLQDVCLK